MNHFFFGALILGRVFQLNILFPNKFLPSLIEPTIV